MHKKHLFLLKLILFFVISSLGQNKKNDFKKFNQEDFERYQVAEDNYNFWWYKNDYTWFPKGDTIPYLVNDSGYKGLINYGLEFSLVERKNLIYSETLEMHKLRIEIESCKMSLIDSIIEVTGVIKGGWLNNTVWDHEERENNVDIFIGKKKDTIKLQYLNRLLNPNKVITTYKEEKVDNHIVLDTFFSEYIHTYKHFKTISGNNRKFEIKSKIDKNSILVFGLTNCYAEIFEIGKLAFSDGNNVRKRKNLNTAVYPKVIIRDNIHQNDSYNIDKKEKTTYYKTTEKAENYILLRKYGKAKEEYNNLLESNAYIFARDMHNAVRCAIKSRDYKTAIMWCEKLALKGVPLTYFEENIFIQLKKQPLWKEFLTKYDGLNEQFKKGLNQNLITGVKKLVEKDQEHYIKNSKGEISTEKLAQVTEGIDEEFINLIQKEGFPTEEKIGLNISRKNEIFESTSYFVLLVHSYQTRSTRRKEIKDLFEKNKLYYDAYRSKLDAFKRTGMTCLQIYKGDLYNGKNCGANLAAIRKMKFKFNNLYNFIIDTGNYTIIPYDKESEEKDDHFIKDNYNFITKLTDDWFFYEK